MPFVLLLELGLTVLVHLALIVLPYLTRCPRLGNQLAFSWASYQRTFLALLLFSYTSLVGTSIGFLDCTDIGTARVVVNQPSIDCRSSAYRSLAAFATLVLICELSLPVVLALYLFRKRHAIQQSQADSHEKLWACSILFEIYQPSTFYWHVVILVRRTAYVAASAIFDPVTRGMAFTLLSQACILLQHFAQPYLDHHSNRIEIVSITLHAALSAVVTAFPQPLSSEGATVALVLLIPLPSALLLMAVVVVEGRSALAHWRQSASALSHKQEPAECSLDM